MKIAGTHLFPMEKPDETARAVLELLAAPATSTPFALPRV